MSKKTQEKPLACDFKKLSNKKNVANNHNELICILKIFDMKAPHKTLELTNQTYPKASPDLLVSCLLPSAAANQHLNNINKTRNNKNTKKG